MIMNRLLGYFILASLTTPACQASFFDTLKTKLAAATAAVATNTKNAFDTLTHRTPSSTPPAPTAAITTATSAAQTSIIASIPVPAPMPVVATSAPATATSTSNANNELLGGSTPLPLVAPSPAASTLLLRRQVSESLRADRAPIKVMQRPIVVQPTPTPGKSVSLDSVGAYDRPLYTTVDVGRLEYLQALDEANNQIMSATPPTRTPLPKLPDMTRDSVAAQQAVADQQAADQQKMQDLRDARDTRNAVQIWKNGGGAGFGVIGNVIRERNRARNP